MNAIVIIPAYDPDENLQKIVERMWELDNQIIVVDDGSDMSKSELFCRLGNFAVVLHHEKNMGKGAAIKTALEYIKENIWECDVIGVMDADGQHLPEDMEKLLLKANSKDDALVLGVRDIGKHMPLKSRIGNKITRFVFRILSGVSISDTQTGLRAFSINLIDKMLGIEGDRYEYETNKLFYCVKNGIPIIEMPIKTIYHDKTNSCSHFRPISDSYRIYKDIVKFLLSSLSSFALDYMLFCILAFIFPAGKTGILMANILARLFSGGYNYLVNCKLVFQTETKVQTTLEYISLAVSILILNSVFLQIYVGMFDMAAYKAKVLTEVTLFVISFLVQKKMIFEKEEIDGSAVKI